MLAASGARDDPDLTDFVRLWVAAWARARGSTWHPVEGGWQIDLVGSPLRTRETVLAEPAGATYAHWAEALTGTPDWWLTVITATPRTYPGTPGVVVNAADEALMTTSLGPAETSPPGPAVQLTTEPDRAVASVVLDGESVAEGTVAVVGDTAVFDRIRTAEAYQRRGLGRRVMAALSDWAYAHGASAGVLAASVDGQALYRRLGWVQAGSLVTLRWEAPGPSSPTGL